MRKPAVRVGRSLARIVIAVATAAYGRRMSEQSYLLTRQETAHLLGFSIRTVDRLSAAGELRSAKQGGRVVIERSSVIEYVDRLFQRSARHPAADDGRDAWLPELAARRAAAPSPGQAA